MGVLKFDNTNDRLRFSSLASALSNLPTGAYTVACLVHRETSGGFDAMSYLLNAGETAQGGLSLTDGDDLRLDIVNACEVSLTLTDVTNPEILVVTKTAGTTSPRFHWKVGTGGSWNHQTSTTTAPNMSAATILDIGVWQGTGDPFDGWIGLVGWWAGAMSDPNVELLSDSWRTSDWWNNPHADPVFLAELNVAAASVVDIAGNATSLTDTGPTLDAGETLGSWTFDGTGVTYQYFRPDEDITTTGWSSTPLWSKIDEDTPDGTVITATAS